jgi:ribonuclease BN (tRNA processing enzyme)
VRIGGNTACLDILTSDRQLIIIDAGTGIRRLGQVLGEEHPYRITGTLLISHTHWDHIQGFPFFFPAFTRNNRFVVIGQQKIGQQLEAILAAQVVEPYLPFGYRDLEADLLVKEISDGETMIIGDHTTVQAANLNHPGGCLGFRIKNGGATLAYCTDTTHEEGQLDENVMRLAYRSDLLVHDAQFSPRKKQALAHYGHSSWIEAAQVAQEARVGCLALFHHDPDASDDDLDEALAEARTVFPRTILAREGLSLTLPLTNGLPQ